METGGFCIKKDGTNIDCECPANTAFASEKGCAGKNICKVMSEQFSKFDYLV